MPYVAFTPISSLSWLFLITSFEEIVRSKTPREKKGKKEKQKKQPIKEMRKSQEREMSLHRFFHSRRGLQKNKPKRQKHPQKTRAS